jgi:hypothetical protein
MKSTLRLPYAAAITSATLIVAACLNSPTVPFDASAVAQDAPKQSAVTVERNSPVAGTSDSEGVANLPFARGAVFRCLDDYLEHLEANGAIDLPWWREIRPGVYERAVRMPEAQRETATRAELMQRWGFSC